MKLRTSAPVVALALAFAVAPLTLRADDKKKGGGDKKADEPEIVTQTRSQLPEMRKKLEKWRGLKFSQDVDVRFQTDEEFRAYIQSEMDKDYPPEKADKESRAMARLGVLPANYDIRKELVDTASAQALAHYDPHKKAFFVLKSDIPAEVAEPSMFHELTHALQDQNYDLKTWMEKFTKSDNADAGLAFKFLVEGEATYTMILYAVGGNEAQAEQVIEMQAAMPREQMEAMEKMQAQPGSSTAKALEQRAKLPLSIYRSFIDPYMKGAAMIAKVKQAGGWAAVDALWKEPPCSTSQALRPGKKLIGDLREDPTTIEIADLSSKIGGGWKKTMEETVGELNLEVILHDQLGADQLKPARGWLGDRVFAYEDDKKSPAIVWFLTWTKPEYAKRFADAYAKIIAKKYDATPAGKKLGNRDAQVAEKDGLSHATVLSGADLVILEAVPTASLEALADGAFGAKKTPSAKHPSKASGKD